MHTKLEAAAAIKVLRPFIGNQQLQATGAACYGEEKQFFFDKLCHMADVVNTMPKTYEQDGKGKDAIVYLHYFKNGMDWYITEKDMEAEQLQAYGLADLGHGGELGYISITELIENNVELDFYWTPKTLKECR